MEPPPVRFLEGERLLLRPIEQEDLPICQRWINDPETRRSLLNVFPLDMVSERAWHASHSRARPPANLHLGIVLKDGARLIGTVGFVRIDWVNRVAETGMLIGEPDCRGRGYGTEAKALLLDYGFGDLGLHRVESTVMSFNERSLHCLLRSGYVVEGRKREAILRGGRRHDLVVLGLLREEWESRG